MENYSSNGSYFVALRSGGLCNNLKCLFSTMRLAASNEVEYLTVCKELTLLFPGLKVIDENRIPANTGRLRDWRFMILEEDRLPPNFAQAPTSINYPGLDPQSRYIDFEYERIPKNVRETYLAVIAKLTINPEIERFVNRFSKKHFNSKTISVHVRSWMTDHWDKDLERHKNSFSLKSIIDEMERHKGCKFFVSSDNKDYKQQLARHFGKRMVSYDSQRSDPHYPVVMDFIDLLLLSRNRTLIGSSLSTFTELAWWYGKCRAKTILL